MKFLHPRSLRVRLTLWYSCALLLVGLTLAVASRWALAVSLDHALDQSLRYRLIGLHGFIDENSHEGLDHLAERLRELNHLGELFQVFGPRGDLLAQSEGLSRHHVSTALPPDPGAGMLFRSAGTYRFPVRMATQRIYVHGEALTIEVADPEAKFGSVLNEFYSVLGGSLPLVLLMAAAGGYWLSGRVLRPVDRIIDEARSIDPENLAARLSVPASGDELQRLTETLNAMLGRVERSLQQVRRFTADASHELRAPMTLIYTAAQFALRRERSAEELRESLQKILREAKHCTDLISQLLWLARSDAQTDVMELGARDIRVLVERAASEGRVLAAGKGIAVAAEISESPVKAPVDEASFRRLLLILLDNAVKYTEPGGSVVVRASAEGDEAVISVSDTGAGIQREDLPLIFDRFWRADKVRSRSEGGAGLGLAIAREIAEQHRAKLTVESEPGRGSVFTVRLPTSDSMPVNSYASSERSV